ncbi:cytochrome b [Mesorhizobium sp. NPDC059054]|uniref:cytochrome b n=1 Tax=Mesorhizobium sp. NPDC059054 TaxID=3346711 RepID=UPI0036AFF717
MALLIGNTQARYGWIAILLHWLIALLFIAQIALGLAMVRMTSQRSAFELIQLHKSIGFLLLGLVVLRLAWRLANVTPRLPAGTGLLERRAAPIAHFTLYALQLVLPLTGWALVSASVLEIPSMPFDLFVMPNLPVPVSDASEAWWGTTHAYLAYAAVGLVAVHVLAALRHHFWLGDSVLVRMISPSRRCDDDKPE